MSNNLTQQEEIKAWLLTFPSGSDYKLTIGDRVEQKGFDLEMLATALTKMLIKAELKAETACRKLREKDEQVHKVELIKAQIFGAQYAKQEIMRENEADALFNVDSFITELQQSLNKGTNA